MEQIATRPLQRPSSPTFVVRVEFVTKHRYRVTITDIEGRERHAEQSWPFSPETELNWIEALNGAGSVAGDRRVLLEQIGGGLFETLFFDRELLSAWRVARSQIRRTDGRVLRLALDLEEARHRRLPWESLYDQEDRRFLAQDPQICLLRLVPRAPTAPFVPTRPLRILGMISQPTGMASLNVAAEKEALESTLTPQMKAGYIQVDWIDGTGRATTLATLKDRLDLSERAERPYDILHISGHASWDETRRAGVVWFEDEHREPDPVEGEALARVLPSTLRLVVLNACEGARNEETVPLRSVSGALMQHSNLLAVIASQIELRDVVARDFTRAFYQGLSEHLSVEASMVAARVLIARQDDSPPIWFGPVLHSSLPRASLHLLAQPKPQRAIRWLYAFSLFLLTILMGIIVVTLIRVLGWTGGAFFQVGIWILAGILAVMNRSFLRAASRETALALLLATLVTASWYVYQPQLELPPQEGVVIQIDEPPALVRYVVQVEGTVSPLGEDEHLWLLVQVENAATFTVGEEAQTGLEEGRFDVDELRVGPPADRLVGEKRYTIQPVVVNRAGHEFLTKHAKGFWRYFHPDIRVTPRPSLPNVTVTRR